MKDIHSFKTHMLKRRSIRSFSGDRVDDQLIQDALEIANSAPSGANMQPWFFTVIKDDDLKREIRTQAEQVEYDFYHRRATDEWLDKLRPIKTNEQKKFLTEASHLIVVFYRQCTESDGKLEKTYFPLESTGLATGFLLCSLHLAGLATLTYTPRPATFLNKLCERPRSDHVFMVIAVGKAHQDYQAPVLVKKELDQVSRTTAIF